MHKTQPPSSSLSAKSEAETLSQTTLRVSDQCQTISADALFDAQKRAVCTRNAHAEWVEGTEAHHSAFLIGKIRDVVACPPTPENDESPKNRYLILFSEFARVNIPDIWKGDRNPVRYATLEELGIDPTTLTWEAMPDASSGPETAREDIAVKNSAIRPLSMTDAKRGLALTFGVAPEAIEITVRG